MDIVSTKAVRKYSFLAKTSFASKIAYPLDVISRTFFFALVLFIFTQLWGALLGADSSIAGFSRQQLVWYLMATESIMLSNARIERRIEDDVKSGAVAYILIRPLHFVWYQCAIYFGESASSLIFNILIGSIIATLLVGVPPISVGFLPLILVVMTLAFLLQFLIKIFLALLAFWVEDTGPFFWIYSKVLFTLGGLFVPIDIYPEWLRRVTVAMPFNYILYQPARLFVNFNLASFVQVLGIQAMWSVLLTALVLYIYKQGVKKVSVNGG
ncbi:MAG: hypothetical protein KGZ53_03465 [Peptococcaceae bacterium]|nr:hypothetical protein [Peptococcaceae bacterium]